MTHNEGSSDFFIPQNLDLSLIGSYPVTIRSEIRVPDDYTMTSYTTMFVEYEFTILIEPCQVSTYTTEIMITEILYNIGGMTKTDGLYSFSESSVCNYP